MLSEMHFQPRLKAAMETLQRLKMLELPASLCSLLWKTDVLPKALYGCEVRDVSAQTMTPLASAGKAAIGAKAPLPLNVWRAPEVLTGPPFGDTMVRDPMLEVRERQLRWLQLVCNTPGLVGEVHRAVAWSGSQWTRPNRGFRSALKAVGWKVRRNEQCIRAQKWPTVEPEEAFPGVVVLRPEDDFPMMGAVFTDGSVLSAGGAAAVQPDEELVHTRKVVQPRSSTQCELVALALAMQQRPPQVLTNSLASLMLLQRWDTWPAKRVLCSQDRLEVRQVIHAARALAVAPVVVKVKAHDEAAIRLGTQEQWGMIWQTRGPGERQQSKDMCCGRRMPGCSLIQWSCWMARENQC